MLLNNQVKQSPIIGLAGLGGGISSYVFLSAGGAYEIARSLRFNSADSAYLSRTPASAGNRKTWTWAGWVKRSTSNRKTLFFAGSGDLNPAAWISFGNNVVDTLEVTLLSQEGISTESWTQTLGVFRDYSAWYHIVCAVDTTQATSSNRVKIYVNGVLQSVQVGPSGSLYPSQNFDTAVNNTVVHNICRRNLAGGDYHFDGYLADVWFIDGQALSASSFGEFDATTGVWNPKRYTGAKSGNSFHLPFSDNTSTTTLGYDDSGNNNNWTLNNFSVAAGAGNDSLLDSPSNDTDTGTGIGGEITGNYCTWNPLINNSGTAATLSNGNLTANSGTTGGGLTVGTFGMPSGKWYWEYTVSSHSGNFETGIIDINASLTNQYPQAYVQGNGYVVDLSNNQKFVGGSPYEQPYGSGGLSTNDLVGIKFDHDNGTIEFFVNNVSRGVAFTGIDTSRTYAPVFGDGNTTLGNTIDSNFGQRPFVYTAPTGFKALNTAELPTPAIEVPSDYVGVTTYTGNGSTQIISGLGFSPDLVIIKRRSASENWTWTDTVRGATKAIYSNLTNAEGTDANGLTAFNSDGFNIGSDSAYNFNTSTYVSYAWKAGGAPTTDNVAGAGNVPTAGSAKIDGANMTTSLAGSIAATRLSVNTTSGFSIVSYTGNNSNATIGHGLNVAPQMVIIKDRDNAQPWVVGHSSIGFTKYLWLNSTNGEAALSTVWQDTAPTSTVFSIGATAGVNASGDKYVAYCFAPVAGYSAFGSYTGNGSADGPFVYTGFRPKFLLVKNTAAANNWCIIDSVRNTYNIIGQRLFPNLSNAEDTQQAIDFLSNGFKIRNAGSSVFNNSGQIYIYAAFAESPFLTQARAR